MSDATSAGPSARTNPIAASWATARFWSMLALVSIEQGQRERQTALLKERHLLRAAVLEDPKVLPIEVGHVTARCVGHGDVHRDEHRRRFETATVARRHQDSGRTSAGWLTISSATMIEGTHARHGLPISLCGHGVAYRDHSGSGARGQFDRHARPAMIEARGTRDMPAVQFDDLPAHIQADACASGMPAIVEVLVLEAKELLEDASRNAAGTPGPVSVTRMMTAPTSLCPASWADLAPLTEMVPPPGVYLSAFDSRLSNTTRSRR